jgi:FAD/FMN-containing dehydrogenase
MAGMLMTGAHGSSMKKASSFGQLLTEVDWVDASGKQHTTTEPKRLIGTNGLFGILTKLTMKVRKLVCKRHLLNLLPADRVALLTVELCFEHPCTTMCLSFP